MASAAPDLAECRSIFRGFLAVHAHKAPTPPRDGTRVAYLQFYDPQRPLAADAPLLALGQDDILDALDPDGSELVRWLLEQLRTYDCDRQRIVGLIFDRATVLSEVLRCPEGR